MQALHNTVGPPRGGSESPRYCHGITRCSCYSFNDNHDTRYLERGFFVIGSLAFIAGYLTREQAAKRSIALLPPLAWIPGLPVISDNLLSVFACEKRPFLFSLLCATRRLWSPPFNLCFVLVLFGLLVF